MTKNGDLIKAEISKLALQTKQNLKPDDPICHLMVLMCKMQKNCLLDILEMYFYSHTSVHELSAALSQKAAQITASLSLFSEK